MSQTAGLNAVPSGERVHIGFFGMRNAGKSSLVNAFTGQQVAIVSDVAGTTRKAQQPIRFIKLWNFYRWDRL